ncbi:hypothetical protein N7532_006886 [Penicillium argentinense]|uniref:NAD-dependent epimerase/dehydratase domain-containing protein n=1 Tax=Penicillium argentinense TaxID=1131581 RepID=A0A9W9KB84_9EURO|nr:uncharacterized protein N7532_006886 [Penicillium argentinense]KAJ5099885.1 hypothetical protein N7532_006886 [Penicillium argentinense]
MSHNILVTGASGYLGGSLLARWSSAKLPAYRRLYALVRTDEQSEAVKQYGADPIKFDVNDEASIRAAIVENDISIIYFLIDAMASTTQLHMIKALAEVRKKTGRDVHFLHTSGAKLFSSHAGLPTDRPIPDNDPELYNLQKTSVPRFGPVGKAMEANNTIIETADNYGVRSYIFVPCIVYGEGEGFGNKTSIQTVAIVNAATKAGKVYRPDPTGYTWPVCHVVDNSNLYLEICRNILSGKEIGYGKNGYYLAASGSVAWNDLYSAMARRLAERKIVDTEKVELADDQALENMGVALECPKEIVPLFLGGKCTLEAHNGREIGWNPQYLPAHILEMASAEVDTILENTGAKSS